MNNMEMKTLDINQIKEYLPHRYPLLLVDRVLNWESGKSITALKNVTANEEFFNGHFPHKPVMPGVLMIEALAQTAALLSFMTMGQKPDDIRDRKSTRLNSSDSCAYRMSPSA